MSSHCAENWCTDHFLNVESSLKSARLVAIVIIDRFYYMIKFKKTKSQKQEVGLLVSEFRIGSPHEDKVTLKIGQDRPKVLQHLQTSPSGSVLLAWGLFSFNPSWTLFSRSWWSIWASSRALHSWAVRLIADSRIAKTQTANKATEQKILSVGLWI